MHLQSSDWDWLHQLLNLCAAGSSMRSFSVRLGPVALAAKLKHFQQLIPQLLQSGRKGELMWNHPYRANVPMTCTSKNDAQNCTTSQHLRIACHSVIAFFAKSSFTGAIGALERANFAISTSKFLHARSFLEMAEMLKMLKSEILRYMPDAGFKAAVSCRSLRAKARLVMIFWTFELRSSAMFTMFSRIDFVIFHPVSLKMADVVHAVLSLGHRCSNGACAREWYASGTLPVRRSPALCILVAFDILIRWPLYGSWTSRTARTESGSFYVVRDLPNHVYIYMIISYIIICAISNVSYSFTLSWMTFIGSQTVGQVGQVGYILTSHNSVDSGRRLLALDGLGWPEHMPYMPQDARWPGGSSLSVQNRRTPATSGNQFDQFDPVWPPLNCVWYRFSLHNSWYCNSCLHD